MALYRILLVDDDDDLRALLRSTLKGRYEVVEAFDGLDALHKLNDVQPDLAILDVEMPMMDGFQLCEAIRHHKDYRGIPILFLSGHGSKENLKKGYAAGADLFMVKPLDPSRVLKNVEFTIEHEKPPLREKRFSVEVLAEVERRAGRGETVDHPPPPTAKAVPAAPPSAPVKTAQPAVVLLKKSVEPSPSRAAAEPAPIEPQGDLKPRVMLVDNEEDALKLMDMALRSKFEITMARDGLEAIKKLVEYQPDVLLIDVMMPKMNGFQLLQSIRRNPALARLPVVIVTAKATQRDKEYSLRIGANDFVAKPYSPDDLLKRVFALTQTPDFRISSKKIPIREIVEKEYLQMKAKEAEADVKETKQKYAELQGIIEQEARRHGRS